MKPAEFITPPHHYFDGDAKLRRAEEHLEIYKSFEGFEFDRLAHEGGRADPHEITFRDIVGVSMLSVHVPALGAIWLTGQGKDVISDLLKKIEPWDVPIWNEGAKVHSRSAAWKLWKAVRTRDGIGPCGIGPTTASKLLAIKRPHLLPIRDQYVIWGLFGKSPGEVFDDWSAWQNYLRSDEGIELRNTVEGLRDRVGYPRYTSALRLVDIVVWRTELLKAKGSG